VTLADTKAAWEGRVPNASTIDKKSYQHIEEHRRSMGLSLWRSIPIVGNDLLSSVLYAAGNVAAVSGKVSILVYSCTYNFLTNVDVVWTLRIDISHRDALLLSYGVPRGRVCNPEQRWRIQCFAEHFNETNSSVGILFINLIVHRYSSSIWF
jgi:hypothetical protein